VTPVEKENDSVRGLEQIEKTSVIIFDKPLIGYSKVLLDVNPMQAIARRVPAKHPPRPSNSGPIANSTP
jgi:hypothetical protein